MKIYRNTEVIRIHHSLSSAEQKKAEDFIRKIKPLLSMGEFQIEPTEKNKIFNRQFPLTDQQKREILKSLTADDCYWIGPNDNPRYKTDEVYKFFKDIEVVVFGEPDTTKLYLKMYIKESKTYDMVIVISFHGEGMHDL